MIGWIFLVLLVAVVLWKIGAYNKLIALKGHRLHRMCRSDRPAR